MTTVIRFIHWKASEAEPLVERLRNQGFEVWFEELTPDSYRSVRKRVPDVVLIDLGRLPSHGRETAVYFRSGKSTRTVPIVFVGGAPEKIERVRQTLPDAFYTPWSRVRSTIRRAIRTAPSRPVVPESLLAGYAGTPLPRKLGIKPGTVVALKGAPRDFETRLQPLPGGVTIRRSTRGNRDLTIWFCRCQRELEDGIDALADAVQPRQSLWIAWPKQAAGTSSDLKQNDVRKIGMAAGLVDFKVCAIDETWSGLQFARRRTSRDG